MLYRIKQNDATFKIYLTLNLAGIPVDSIAPADVVADLSKDGGPLSILNVITAAQWFELDPIEAVGVYVLTLPAFWVDTVGSLYLRLRPVTAGTFDSQVVSIQVEPYALTDLYTQSTRILGLSQENFRMDSHVYNTRGELLSARVRIYADAVDAVADIASIGEYNVTSSYDGSGRLTTYLMTKV